MKMSVGLLGECSCSRPAGLAHDGDENGCRKDAFVMTAVVRAGHHAWSNCSRVEYRRFLRHLACQFPLPLIPLLSIAEDLLLEGGDAGVVPGAAVAAAGDAGQVAVAGAALPARRPVPPGPGPLLPALRFWVRAGGRLQPALVQRRLLLHQRLPFGPGGDPLRPRPGFTSSRAPFGRRGREGCWEVCERGECRRSNSLLKPLDGGWGLWRELPANGWIPDRIEDRDPRVRPCVAGECGRRACSECAIASQLSLKRLLRLCNKPKYTSY